MDYIHHTLPILAVLIFSAMTFVSYLRVKIWLESLSIGWRLAGFAFLIGSLAVFVPLAWMALGLLMKRGG